MVPSDELNAVEEVMERRRNTIEKPCMTCEELDLRFTKPRQERAQLLLAQQEATNLGQRLQELEQQEVVALSAIVEHRAADHHPCSRA